MLPETLMLYLQQVLNQLPSLPSHVVTERFSWLVRFRGCAAEHTSAAPPNCARFSLRVTKPLARRARRADVAAAFGAHS